MQHEFSYDFVTFSERYSLLGKIVGCICSICKSMLACIFHIFSALPQLRYLNLSACDIEDRKSVV